MLAADAMNDAKRMNTSHVRSCHVTAVAVVVGFWPPVPHTGDSCMAAWQEPTGSQCHQRDPTARWSVPRLSQTLEPVADPSRPGVGTARRTPASATTPAPTLAAALRSAIATCAGRSAAHASERPGAQAPGHASGVGRDTRVAELPDSDDWSASAAGDMRRLENLRRTRGDCRSRVPVLPMRARDVPIREMPASASSRCPLVVVR